MPVVRNDLTEVVLTSGAHAREHCFADPDALLAAGVDELDILLLAPDRRFQIRVTRPGFGSAAYTVCAAPEADRGTGIVRMGKDGRGRLGLEDGVEVTLSATVVDDPCPQTALHLCEALVPGDRPDVLVLGPHGGFIESPTDDQVVAVLGRLGGPGVTGWTCDGRGEAPFGAHARWHITSTELSTVSFPKLGAALARRYRVAVSFHGFDWSPDDGVPPEATLVIGGASIPGSPRAPATRASSSTARARRTWAAPSPRTSSTARPTSACRSSRRRSGATRTPSASRSRSPTASPSSSGRGSGSTARSSPARPCSRACARRSTTRATTSTRRPIPTTRGPTRRRPARPRAGTAPGQRWRHSASASSCSTPAAARTRSRTLTPV
jgi:hypothetical protein